MIPAPNLDDRRFQDLVDDAKRLVQQRCPEWSDHNVSDPGVTLIEAFATMVDQLFYRLNRVPDRNYLHFLKLLGTQLHPPVSARADVTFWLSAPRPDTVTVPAGTEVSTPNSELTEPVVFSTEHDAVVIPCELRHLATKTTEGELTDRTGDLVRETPIDCFGVQPAPGDALYFGLSEPIPHCAVALRLTAQVEGVGVDPSFPPLRWEVWTGSAWERAVVDVDETGGLNRSGDVVLHVPETHAVSVIAGQRAAWLRCLLTDPELGQTFYSVSPRLHAASAFTIGVSTPALHAELVPGELIGTSDGTPGQRFELSRRPLTSIGADVVEVAEGSGWERWTQVEHFAESGAYDRHFALDRHAGDIVFGPAVRGPQGELTQYGAVPPKGAIMRVPSYHVGGGRRGNVAARSLALLRTAIPFVSDVTNRRPAAGGVDAEDLESAKVRAPLLLRTRSRAVTAEDYEVLVAEAAPTVARVRALSDPDEHGVVRVLVVPAVETRPDGRVPFDELRPTPDLTRGIGEYLDERRILGVRVVVEPPFYRGITVVARLTAGSRSSAGFARDRALQALHRYLHPVHGGLESTGWPFGRAVTAGEVRGVLERLDEVNAVEDVRLFAADPISGQRTTSPESRVELRPGELTFSFEHQILVT